MISDHYPIVKETIDQASQVLGYDLRHLIDREEEKNSIRPAATTAILAASCYLPFIARAISLIWLLVCLLEYSALVASGALDFESAVALV